MAQIGPEQALRSGPTPDVRDIEHTFGQTMRTGDPQCTVPNGYNPLDCDLTLARLRIVVSKPLIAVVGPHGGSRSLQLHSTAPCGILSVIQFLRRIAKVIAREIYRDETIGYRSDNKYSCD